MDGIKNFHKGIFYILLYFCILSSLSCKEKFPEKKIPLLQTEVEYDYIKMIDAQKDHPVDETSYDYSLKIIKEEKEFLKQCESISDDNSLIGSWKLVNAESKEIKNNSFLFNELISISKYNESIVLDNWGNRSILYHGSNNRYYIYTRGIGIIRMIKIHDDQLFVYIIQNKEWVLDPIHNDGVYSFKKEKNEPDYFSPDINDWFEKL